MRRPVEERGSVTPLVAVIAIALVVSIAMRDTRRYSALGRHE